MKIKIIADSTSDLSPDLIDKFNITIAPLGLIMGGIPFKDGIDISPVQLFDFVDSGKGICHTVAVNIQEYSELYRNALSSHDAVIHFTISSDMSACFQNATIAAADYDNVFIVDSRTLSTGIAHLVLDAVELAQQGMKPSAIKAELDERKKRLDVSFIINTLKYLHKGGRCSSVAALGANLLQLKPCIEVSDGKMTVGKKYRGNLEKVLRQYVTDKLSTANKPELRRVFITHTTPDRNLLALVHSLLTDFGFEQIIETDAGCSIATHCGPYCLGILFYRCS